MPHFSRENSKLGHYLPPRIPSIAPYAILISCSPRFNLPQLPLIPNP